MKNQDTSENQVKIVYLALGSNLGSKVMNIEKAKLLLLKNNVQIIQSSNYYETYSWPNKNFPKYLNIILKTKTKLNLQNLDMPDIKMNNKLNKVENVKTKIIEINNEELELHKKFLKTSLQKNYFK